MARDATTFEGAVPKTLKREDKGEAMKEDLRLPLEKLLGRMTKQALPKLISAGWETAKVVCFS